VIEPLSLREKLSYGVADIGASLSYNAVNVFFLFFLVEVLGLAAALAGLVLLVGRVLDAVTDPLMGLLSDRTRSRWGRRKPYIWAGAVPFGLSFALLWTLPESSQPVMFALAAAFLTLHAVIYTVVQVPYMALTPELAPEYAARTELTSYRIGFGTVASLVAVAVPPVLVAALNSFLGQPEGARAGWPLMGAVFGMIMSLSYLVMAWGVRERGRPPAVGPLRPLDEYRSALRVHGYGQVLVLFVVVTLGLGIISSMLPFFLASALLLGPSERSLLLGLFFLVAVLTLPFWTRLGARLDKRLAFALGLALLAAVVPVLVLFAPPGELALFTLVMTAVAGVGVGALLLFPWAMVPDVVEFDELQSGRRREGLFYAIFTFGQKTAFAVGAFLNAQVLALLGYRSTAMEAAMEMGAVSQSAEAVLGIKLMVGPVAAGVFAVAALLALRVPITRATHDAVRARLAERGAGAR
jgi:GPH family glycoside/pentoside/hexuronide:cation symporter